MEKELLKIKLSVADRLYPLSTEPEQEESFRLAAKKIGEMIQSFEEHYDLRDKQDALAMCAIVLARQAAQEKIDDDKEDQALKQKLENIYNLLDKTVWKRTSSYTYKKFTAYIDCSFGKLNINIKKKGEFGVAKARRHCNGYLPHSVSLNLFHRVLRETT